MSTAMASEGNGLEGVLRHIAAEGGYPLSEVLHRNGPGAPEQREADDLGRALICLETISVATNSQALADATDDPHAGVAQSIAELQNLALGSKNTNARRTSVFGLVHALNINNPELRESAIDALRTIHRAAALSPGDTDVSTDRFLCERLNDEIRCHPGGALHDMLESILSQAA